jgi:hypothetical protein
LFTECERIQIQLAILSEVLHFQMLLHMPKHLSDSTYEYAFIYMPMDSNANWPAIHMVVTNDLVLEIALKYCWMQWGYLLASPHGYASQEGSTC